MMAVARFDCLNRFAIHAPAVERSGTGQPAALQTSDHWIRESSQRARYAKRSGVMSVSSSGVALVRLRSISSPALSTRQPPLVYQVRASPGLAQLLSGEASSNIWAAALSRASSLQGIACE